MYFLFILAGNVATLRFTYDLYLFVFQSKSFQKLK